MPEGEVPLQRNEGKWDFTLGESEDGCGAGACIHTYSHTPLSACVAALQPLPNANAASRAIAQ